MTGLDNSFFAGNRERTYDALKGSLLVVPAYTGMQRSNDTSFYFEQEANFWYLTGIDYPDWWLFMDGKRRKAWLVAPHVNDVHQVFDGSLSAEDATKISGITEIMDRQAADMWLRQAARAHQLVYTVGVPFGAEYFDFTLNPVAHEMEDKLKRIFTTVRSFNLELARLRAIKQPVELKMMQKAIDVTIAGYERVRSEINNYKYEYEIEADFTHAFRRLGASGHAYDPIVAYGQNACTLHYIRNDSKIKKGNFVLFDVGARYGGYSADISRTYIVGEPTVRQRAVHVAVQVAHERIISLVKPGLGLQEYFVKVDEIMQAALVELGLMKPGDNEAYRRYFPHSISHGLGIDVHDALGRPDKLLPGMVFTVEPGIYIPEEKIGVRIEDDILVTETGYKNMSKKLSTDM